MKILRPLLTVVFAVQIALANAAAIDPNKSSVTATFRQVGVDVTAKFDGVSGAIDFDPANPASGKARVVVALASFDLGEPEYDQEVQKKTWFNSAQYPQATFVSTAIKSLGAGRLQVQGKLTIKGKTLDVSVPIAFEQNGKTQIFTGTLPIKRLDFNIGEGEWSDTDTLADDVVVKFKAVTSK